MCACIVAVFAAGCDGEAMVCSSLCSAHGPRGMYVLFVSPFDDGVVDKMPVLRATVHLKHLVMGEEA